MGVGRGLIRVRGMLAPAAVVAAALMLGAAPGSAAAAPWAGHVRASREHAAAAPALAGSGTIEGTVTDAVKKTDVAGIEVCAYSTEVEAFEIRCATTTAAGTYALSVPAGEYAVEFASPYESGLNYVTVYQDGYTSFEEAEEHPLVVTSGGTDSGVDAAMSEGGHIEGHVADAVQPSVAIEEVEVCAIRLREGPGEPEGFGCAATDASGDYELSGLPTGNYVVFFEPPPNSNYIRQVYENSATVKGAKHVGVTALKTTTGIDALLARGGEIAGKLTAAPSGEPLEGAFACALLSEKQAATCAPTNMAGEYNLRGLAPGSYAVGFEAPGYQWQYYPSGQTFALAQQIEVASGAGVGLVTTELLPVGYVKPPPVKPVVPPSTPPATSPSAPPPAPAGEVAASTTRKPAIVITSLRLRPSHGHIAVQVSCAGAACTGTLQLTMRVAYRTRRHGRMVTRHRSVVLATGAFSLAAGAHGTVSLSETAAGRAHLAHAARSPVSAQLLGLVSGGAPLAVGVHIG